MVAGAETADLTGATLHRSVTDRARLGSADRAAVLAVVEVRLDAVPALDRVTGATDEYVVELAPVTCQRPPAPSPRGISRSSASINAGSSGARSSRSVVETSRRTPHEMSKPTPPGDTTPPSLDVSRGDAPDREAVSPMDVGHRVRRLDDPRQRRHVRDLLEGAVLDDIGEQLAGREDDAGDTHRAASRDAPSLRPPLRPARASSDVQDDVTAPAVFVATEA